jgi:hypothetical protein
LQFHIYVACNTLSMPTYRSQGLTAYQKNKSGRAIIIFRIDNFIPFVFDSLSQSSNFDD